MEGISNLNKRQIRLKEQARSHPIRQAILDRGLTTVQEVMKHLFLAEDDARRNLNILKRANLIKNDEN